MAPWLALASFLLIVSQQVATAATTGTRLSIPIQNPSNLQPAASPSEGSSNGESTGDVLSAGNCELYLQKLYVNLLRAYDVWYNFIQIGPETQQGLLQCALPPYTSPEKKELCLEETAQSYESQTTDLMSAMSGVLPEILGSMENLEKCIESASPAPQPYKKLAL